jgi:drug/metabolite transporter (DMT)-like permease
VTNPASLPACLPAVTLAQLRPPVMAVMGYLLLHEPLGWLGAAGCLISLVGATIVSHPPFLFGGHSQWGQQRLLGTLCGMASPCFGAGTGYCIRRIQKQEPALVVALYFHICTVGGGFVCCLLSVLCLLGSEWSGSFVFWYSTEQKLCVRT